MYVERCIASTKAFVSFFQSNDAHLISAYGRIEQAKTAMQAMKVLPEKSLKRMNECFNATGKFKGVVLERTSADEEHFKSINEQFFQCLTDNCELLYHHTEFYKPNVEAGIKYDDPKINIEWPMSVTIISERDRSHNYLNENFKGI